MANCSCLVYTRNKKGDVEFPKVTIDDEEPPF